MTTPTGNFALTLDNLAVLVSNSTTFQTAVGAASAALAKPSVYWPTEDPKTLGSYPDVYAWIKIADGWNSRIDGTGPGSDWRTMPLQLLLSKSLVATDTPKEQQIKFWNYIGAVVGEMEDLANSAGYLIVASIQLESANMSDPDEEDLYGEALFDVEVG